MFKFMPGLLLLILFLGTGAVSSQDMRQQIDSVNAIPYNDIVSNPRKAINQLSKNVENARSIQYRYGEARALEQLNLAYYIKGNWKECTEAILQAIKIYDELGEIKHLASSYGIFGYQQRRRDINTALTYMRKGIRLAETHGLKENLCTLYDNYGVIQEDINNKDSALFYFKKSLKLKKALKDSLGIPFSLNKIVNHFIFRKDFEQAFDYLHQSDAYRKLEKGKFGRAENLVIRADINNAMGKLDSALHYYSLALQKALEIEYKVLTQYSYQKLTEVYEKKGDFQKALQNQKRAIAYKDSLLNIETNRIISELEVAYETEKKDLELTKKKLEIRRKNNLLLFMFSMVGFLVTMLFGFYLFQRIKREQLRRELELKSKLHQSELEKKLSEEKLRIALELHDNIGSHLTFMISSADNLIYGIKEERIRASLAKLSQFGRKTMQELRNSIWAMKHEEGDTDLLFLRVNEFKQQMVRDHEGLKIEIINQLSKPVKLNSIQMLNLLRLVQEGLQNTLKHAEATRVQIIFSETENGFELKISDNGKGFDGQRIRTGNGLFNMRQRCQEAGVELLINSSNGGTSLICRVPADETLS